jgi:hypothetical protein
VELGAFAGGIRAVGGYYGSDHVKGQSSGGDAGTILNLRVVLLSGVWTEAFQRILQNVENVQVPTYDMPEGQTFKLAA